MTFVTALGVALLAAALGTRLARLLLCRAFLALARAAAAAAEAILDDDEGR